MSLLSWGGGCRGNFRNEGLSQVGELADATRWELVIPAVFGFVEATYEGVAEGSVVRSGAIRGLEH